MPDLRDIADLGICRNCIGRLYSTVGDSMDNDTRGKMLIFSLRATQPEFDFQTIESEECPICKGIFSNFELYYNIVMDEIGDLEYSTFLMGSIFGHDTLKRESEIQNRVGSVGESIKKEFNREFGKYFSERTGKDVSFTEPDLTLVVDTRYDYAKTEIRSIFLRGRYNKLKRDLPQTRWIHQPENDDSVEYFIGSPILSLTGGDNFYLHAAGREDVDVRMLGGGRDFVIEISRPLKRTLDPSLLEENINSTNEAVKVQGLEYCTKEEIKKVKSSTFDKTYRVHVHGTSELSKERLKAALVDITGKVIYQRTPLRVAVRRADLIRERTVVESVLEEVQGMDASILIRAQSGMYIKELVNGDEGRTNPSLSSCYGEKLTVTQLDVIEINRGN